MVIYCKSVHFRGFSSPGTPGQAFYEMVSFSENRILRLLQESGELWPCAPGWGKGAGCSLVMGLVGNLPWLHYPGRASTPHCHPWSWWGGLRQTPTSDHPSPPTIGNSLVRHHVSHLSRIYPAGWRTDSSNYSPVEMWNGGCQIGMGRWGCGEAWRGGSGQRAREREPVGTQPGPGAGVCGLSSR